MMITKTENVTMTTENGWWHETDQIGWWAIEFWDGAATVTFSSGKYDSYGDPLTDQTLTAPRTWEYV